MLALLAATVAGCGGDAAGPLAAVKERVGDAMVVPTPTPTPTPTPEPTPSSASSLLVAGDVNFEDHDPEVVLLAEGDKLRVELRHREAGSARADSILTLLGVPREAGTYSLRPPATGAGPRAFFTSRSERVGSMKDFNHLVSGTLELREESPGVLAGAVRLAAQEPPPPPRPTPRPGEPPPNMLGLRPPPPPASIQATGSFLVVLSAVRPAPDPEPGIPAAMSSPAPPPAVPPARRGR